MNTFALSRTDYNAMVTQNFTNVPRTLSDTWLSVRRPVDLKKVLPRIPFIDGKEDFWAFSRAGQELADWHLNYESVAPWPREEVEVRFSDPGTNYRPGQRCAPAACWNHLGLVNHEML